ncbi:DUF2878 domain-containing protein [Vibrio aestuarianus]|uniref:DUF2878 domain-containing protein n=1 Tax=Vibrio aestuarianus TaxID=28171 RepID=UPI0020B110C8|nr:DUF2878 domain-containing protein [Vibrio aestuarianus]
MMKKLWLVSVWFQILWLVAVLGTYAWQWVTVCLVLATFIYTVIKQPIALERVIILAFIGIAIDLLNMEFDVIVFPTSQFPIWLMALWFAFSWYAYYIVQYVNRFPSALVSMIGGISGCLCYWAAQRLGSAQFGLPTLAVLLILWLEWTMICALMLRIFRNVQLKNKELSTRHHSAMHNHKR